MLPPTWTEVPLTPYTPTPIPPTRTPWPTPASPTPSPTLAPEQITATSNLFELLHGTATSTSTEISQTELAQTATPTARAVVSTPTSIPCSSQPFYRRIGPVGLLLLALLAFLIPLVIVSARLSPRSLTTFLENQPLICHCERSEAISFCLVCTKCSRFRIRNAPALRPSDISGSILFNIRNDNSPPFRPNTSKSKSISRFCYSSR